MGTTSKRGLRYPEATVLANTLHTRIQELATDTDLAIDYTSLGGGFQRFNNLAQYQEASNNLPGYLVVQTNISYDNVMTRLHIQGYTYETPNNIIDLIITLYPFATGASINQVDIVNKGSYCFKSIGVYHRNSDNKLAIVLESAAIMTPVNTWKYPKLTVDGMFAHTGVPLANLQSGWSISRVTSLAAYTAKYTTTAKGCRGLASDTGWIDLPTINSWSSYNTSFPALYKREGDWVTVKGLVKKSIAVTNSDNVAQLPSGFFPEVAEIFNCSTPTTPFSAYVYVNPNGIIQIGAGANASWTSMSGIKFRAVA